MVSYGSGSIKVLEWDENNFDISCDDIGAQIYAYSDLNVPQNASIELNFVPQLASDVEIELYAGIGYSLDYVVTIKKNLAF